MSSAGVIGHSFFFLVLILYLLRFRSWSSPGLIWQLSCLFGPMPHVHAVARPRDAHVRPDPSSRGPSSSSRSATWLTLCYAPRRSSAHVTQNQEPTSFQLPSLIREGARCLVVGMSA